MHSQATAEFAHRYFAGFTSPFTIIELREHGQINKFIKRTLTTTNTSDHYFKIEHIWCSLKDKTKPQKKTHVTIRHVFAAKNIITQK